MSFAHSVRRPSRLCSRCVAELDRRTRLGTVMEYCKSQSQATKLFSYKFFKRMTHRGSDAHSLAKSTGRRIHNQRHTRMPARPINQCKQPMQKHDGYAPHAIAGVH